jgi:hypothetical protein
MPLLKVTDASSIIAKIVESVTDNIGPMAKPVSVMTDSCNTMRGNYSLYYTELLV